MENNVKSQYNNKIAHIKSIRNILHIQRETQTSGLRLIYRLKHHTYILKRKYYQPNAAKPADVYHSVKRYALSVDKLTPGIN